MLAIIEYGMGNTRSVANAFELLGHDVEITSNPENIKSADAIVLPGVGAFADGMENLRKKGLLELLNTQVIENKKPYLGICLGLEFLAKNSKEDGLHEGFGWIDGTIDRIQPNDSSLKIPHMGWNDTILQNNSVLLNEMSELSFYYLHSYYLKVAESEQKFVTSTCDYGNVQIISSFEKNNIFAVQFHPEKSQNIGLKLLQNFAQQL